MAGSSSNPSPSSHAGWQLWPYAALSIIKHPGSSALSRDFPERDWKHLRVVHAQALQRFCAQTLAESQGVLSDDARTPHERYIALYMVIRQRDAEMARLFNDLRRSTAALHLAGLVPSGLVTAEELAGFLEGARAHLPGHEVQPEESGSLS